MLICERRAGDAVLLVLLLDRNDLVRSATSIAASRRVMRFDIADLCWRDTPSPDEVLVDQEHMLVAIRLPDD